MHRYGTIGLLLFYIVSNLQAQGASERCYTPERQIGKCIDIRQCPTLLQLLQGPRPLPGETVDYLRRSQCGFEGRNPLVCCPSKTDAFTPRPPPSITQPSATRKPDLGPIDVRSHPGLRHLPDYCGPITETKITGGNETELYEYPWMALLGYMSRSADLIRRAFSDDVQYRCGGSLINNHYVLTAAHCVTSLSTIELVTVRLGEHDQKTVRDCHPVLGCAPAAIDFEVERVIPHPQYVKDDLRNDIALIRLKGGVTFSQAIRPICLPVGEEQRRKLDSEKVTITGWGATENGIASPILLKVDLPIVPQAKCASIYSRTVPITEKQLCAGGLSGKDSCGGDSGGPLQFVGQPIHGGLSYIQHGVVSFGPRQCGTAGRPGVYTRVGYYMDWILNTLRS